MISILTWKVILVLLLCGHPNLSILSSPSLSANYHFSTFDLFPHDLHIHVTRFRKYPLSLLIFVVINRGCYIAARSYEISLQVLTNISQVSAANEWNIFSTREEKFRSSKWYPLSLLIFVVINRGCYIAARSYEISLQVLTNISQVSAANEWNIFSTREEKFRSSKWPCNVLFIIQTPMKYQTISLFKIVNNRERRKLLCSHSNGDISLLKITFYSHMSRYHVFPLVFHWCLFNKVIVLHCNVLVLVNNK